VSFRQFNRYRILGEFGPRPTGAMKIRRAGPEDQSEIAELVRRAGGRAYDLKMLGRRHVWLAVDGKNAVGLTMLEPRTLQWGGQQYRAGYWTNLFVHPDYRTTMLYPRLTLEMFRWAEEAGLDFVYAAVRRQQVAKAHLAIGMRSIGELPVLAKVLRPGSFLAKYKQLGKPTRLLSRGPDSAYAAYLHLRRPRTPPPFSIEELDWNSCDVSRFLDILCSSVGQRVCQAWTSDSLRFRFENPLDGPPYRLIAARKNGRLVSGAVYRVVERDRQIRLGVVMVVAHEPDEFDAARICLAEIERQAFEQNADVILCLPTPDAMTSGALRELGYRESPETYILMCRMTSRTPERRPAQHLSQWQYAFVDHDAF